MNLLLTKTINGQKKVIINNVTKKEEEIIYLYSNPIINNPYDIDNNKNITPPSSVCEFVLGQKLGEGTFGTVRLGTNKQTGEKVAIKILEKIKMINYDDKKRLEREINILKKIHHPNIVKVFCVIETERQIFIVMEYIKGNELFQYIVLKRKLEEEEACYFFLQIINCIDYLHKLKIAHRDLKAENIIIEQNKKEIKLIDFGLSNTYENGQLLSTACGSPIYAAPEMLEGKLYKGSTVDIWSAGVILYYMLCGTFPFEDVSNDNLYRKIIKGKFDIPKSISKNAKDLINKILVVSPSKRINIKDIKKHPWVLKYLETNQNFENIFKNIGLDMGKYVIPIDEDIVNEINNKYKVEKVQIRKNILYNIVNDISTLYYLILNKKCKDGIKSIADMKSDIFENYIKDKNNLLSSYNNNINNVFNKRKYGPDEPNEKSLENKDSNNIENNENNENNELKDEKIFKDNKSYTNIGKPNEDANILSDSDKKDMENKRNKCISVDKQYNKRNQKVDFIKKNIIINRNKKDISKDLSFNYLTVKSKDSYLKKSEKKSNLDFTMAVNVKHKIDNIKTKFNNKKNQSCTKKTKDFNDSISKSVKVNKEKKRIKIQKTDNLTKKEILRENKKSLNKTVHLDTKYKEKKHNKSISFNNNNNYFKSSNSSQKEEKIDVPLLEDTNKQNTNISEFNPSNEKDKNINVNESTPKKIENENNTNNDDNQENKKLNKTNYVLNENQSEKKIKSCLKKDIKNIKDKSNRMVLYKDIKNKNNAINLKGENIKDIYNKDYLIDKNNKNLNNSGNITNSNHNSKDIIYKNEKEKNKGGNNSSSLNNSAIYKRNDNNPLHHKNISSVIGRTADVIKIMNEKDILTSNKKHKTVNKYKNKSFDIKKDSIKSDNLNNNKKYTTQIKNFNKIKLNKNNKTKGMSSISTTSNLTALSDTDKNINNVDNFYKPIDINCLLIKNEKIIKDEILKLSENNNNIKIKNLQKNKFLINFKSLDLSVELIIEKNDNVLSILKTKKIKGKQSDYSNQLNIILSKLNN